MTSGERKTAVGEVLVLDQDEKSLAALTAVLGQVGLLVTALKDASQASHQIATRFIPVALIDNDTPSLDGGLELVKFARAKSPLTVPLLMISGKSFEAATAGFRAGAADVFPKTEDGFAYLRDRVLAAATEVKAADNAAELLREVGDFHEEVLKKVMDLSRHVMDLEDRLLARDEGVTDEGVTESAATLGGLVVLVVDDQPTLAADLERLLPAGGAWRVQSKQSGGEALDSAGDTPPSVLLVKENLPDLPGRMVVKTIKATAPDVVALLFSPPGEGAAGKLDMVEHSRLLPVIPSFSDPAQLVDALEQIREGLRKKSKERKYLKAFKQQNLEFLQRYGALRQRLDAGG